MVQHLSERQSVLRGGFGTTSTDVVDSEEVDVDSVRSLSSKIAESEGGNNSAEESVKKREGIDKDA